MVKNHKSQYINLYEEFFLDGFIDQILDEEIYDLALDKEESDLFSLPSFHGNIILRKGSRGSTVFELQQLLAKAGFNLVSDGIFGSNTDRVVRNFQSSQGLSVDGIVGPNTWNALLIGLASTPVAKPTYPSSFLSTFKKRVRDIALKEWEFFGRGREKEDQPGFYQRVGDYWKQGVNRNLDGRDRGTPWSAAFISWVMRKAGAGNQFKYSSLHADYIRDAIQKRKINDKNAAFKGYKVEEYAPKVGDLVCQSRGKDAWRVGYDTTRSYSSHCDLVVSTKPGQIDVIGGNVSDSVGRKTYKTDATGKLPKGKYPWIAVIKTSL